MDLGRWTTAIAVTSALLMGAACGDRSAPDVHAQARPSTTSTTTNPIEGGPTQAEQAQPPYAAGTVPGRPYPYVLLTHCGYFQAQIDGRISETDKTPASNADVNGPFWTHGTMTLVNNTQATFHADNGDNVTFHPLTGPPTRACS